jgi:hypothetical protein
MRAFAMSYRDLPAPLRNANRIHDILLHAREVAFDYVDPVHLYLHSRGIDLTKARLNRGVLLSHPRLGNWAARGITSPAMILVAQGAETRTLDVTFLTEAGGLAPIFPRLRLGAFDGHVAHLAGAAGEPDLALLAQSGEGALRAIAAGFPGHVLCAVALGNMARIRLPEGVSRLHLYFERDALSSGREAVVASFTARGYQVLEWTDPVRVAPAGEVAP